MRKNRYLSVVIACALAILPTLLHQSLIPKARVISIFSHSYDNDNNYYDYYRCHFDFYRLQLI